MPTGVQHTNIAEFKPRRWRRRLKWLAIGSVVFCLVMGLVLKNRIRTLTSLRRVPGTNAYVMDYYVDYHLDEICENGVDVNDLEGSFIDAMLPTFIAPIANGMKRAFLPKKIETIHQASPGHRCSTVAIKSNQGQVFFGRNFDYHNDAFLILRIHDRGILTSISVIDLAYLNLNRSDLDQTSLLDRLPLLFTPYYLMDGMNRHGVAISDMSVPHAEPPRTTGNPSIIQSTLMRIILDQAKTADEAVQIIQQYNLHFVEVPEHLMIADAAGNFRIVEFIDGEMRVTSTDQNWQVCTNHIVWQKSEQENDETCYRYRAGSLAAENLNGNLELINARSVIRKMSVDNWTMWTSVYDLTNRKIRVLYKSDLDAEYLDAIDD